MTETDVARKLDELESLLNDPDTRMEPSRVWSLLAEIRHHDMPANWVNKLEQAHAAGR
jgi:hypothetical protein